MSLILASTSPRRKELMQKLGIPFKVYPSFFAENFDPSDDPQKIVLVLSQGKARSVASALAEGTVIGADTLVVGTDRILGKPQSPADARATLAFLSGKKHGVVTGVTVINTETKKEISFVESAEVTFRQIPEMEIQAYVATGEPLDKAGSYAIQGGGAAFVEKIQGDVDTVVGLPTARLKEILIKEFGFK